MPKENELNAQLFDIHHALEMDDEDSDIVERARYVMRRLREAERLLGQAIGRV